MNYSFEILSFLSFFVALNHVVSAKIIDDGLEVAGGTKSIYFHLLLLLVVVGLSILQYTFVLLSSKGTEHKL